MSKVMELSSPLLEEQSSPTKKRCNYARLSCILCTVLLPIALGIILASFYISAAMKAASFEIKLSLSPPSEVNAMKMMVLVEGTVDNRNLFSIDVGASVLSVVYDGHSLATMSMPSLSITGGALTPMVFTAEFEVTDLAAFNAMGHQIFSEDVSTELSGKVPIHWVGLPLGKITLRKSVTLSGFASFADPPMEIGTINLLEGKPDMVEAEADGVLVNPASLALIAFPSLQFQLFAQGQWVGSLWSGNNFTVGFGVNALTSRANLHRTLDNQQTFETLMSNYTSGLPSLLEVRGNENTTDFILLKGLFGSLAFTATLPGLIHQEDKLGRTGYVFLDLDSVWEPKKECFFTELHYGTLGSIFLRNPFNLSLAVSAVDITVTWAGSPEDGIPPTYFGTVRKEQLGFALEPEETGAFESMICLTEDVSAYMLLLEWAQRRGIDVDGKYPFPLDANIAGTVMGDIDAMKGVNLTYAQTGVTIVAFLKQAH